jgi:VWFA-related protein
MVLLKKGIMMNRLFSFVTFFCLFVFGFCFMNNSLPAQEAPAGSTLRVEVDLVTVEVVALDKENERISNLGRNDFKLFEDGKEVPIASFDVVSGTEKQAIPTSLKDIDERDRPGNVLLVLLDEGTIARERALTMRELAANYVKAHMRPYDFFGVVTYGRELKIAQNLTHDAQKVLEAIGKSPEVFNKQSQSGRGYGLEYFRALNQLVDSMSRIKGRKGLMFFTEGFTVGSDLEQFLEGLIRNAYRSNVVFYSIDAQGVERNKAEGKSLKSDQGYSMDRRTQHVDQSDPMQASRGGSVTSLGDDQGFSRDAVRAVSQSQNILRVLADRTGGIAIYGTNDFQPGLEKIHEELNSYYVLGFRPANPRQDGSLRKIEVKSEVKGLQLRYRRAYQDPRPPDVFAGAKSDQTLLNALSSPAAATQLGVQIQALYFYHAGPLVQVPLYARIEGKGIELKKKGNRLNAELSLMAAAFAEDGSLAARVSESIPVDIDKEQEKALRSSYIPYQNSIRLRPGKYRLKMVVSDEKGTAGTAEQPLEIPPLPAKGFASSSLLVTQEFAPLPELIQGLDAGLLAESDPLVYKEFQFSVNFASRIVREKPVGVFYKLARLGGPSQLKSLTVQVITLDEKGSENAFAPMELGDLAVATGPEEAVVFISFPVNEWLPGKHLLVVETADQSTGAKVRSEAPLVLP